MLCFFLFRYPQEFVIELGTQVAISRIKTATNNVRDLQIDRCYGPVGDWEPVFRVSIAEGADGHLQMESNQVNRVKAQRLRVRINSGWSNFSTVHNISVEANISA